MTISTLERDGSLLAGLPPAELQRFKEYFRRHQAVKAGANAAQLAALHGLDTSYNTHFPVYRSRPDGTLRVTYTSARTGTVEALVSLDGTTRQEHP